MLRNTDLGAGNNPIAVSESMSKQQSGEEEEFSHRKLLDSYREQLVENGDLKPEPKQHQETTSEPRANSTPKGTLIYQLHRSSQRNHSDNLPVAAHSSYSSHEDRHDIVASRTDDGSAISIKRKSARKPALDRQFLEDTHSIASGEEHRSRQSYDAEDFTIARRPTAHNIQDSPLLRSNSIGIESDQLADSQTQANKVEDKPLVHTIGDFSDVKRFEVNFGGGGGSESQSENDGRLPLKGRYLLGPLSNDLVS